MDYAPFSKLHESSWKIMNDFTHVGIEHINRHCNNGEMGYKNYDPNEIIHIIKRSGLLSLYAFLFLAIIAKNNQLVSETIKKTESYIAQIATK